MKRCFAEKIRSPPHFYPHQTCCTVLYRRRESRRNRRNRCGQFPPLAFSTSLLQIPNQNLKLKGFRPDNTEHSKMRLVTNSTFHCAALQFPLFSPRSSASKQPNKKAEKTLHIRNSQSKSFPRFFSQHPISPSFSLHLTKPKTISNQQN